MQTYARYTGTCTYCRHPIKADAEPVSREKGFWGPLNVEWFHVDAASRRIDADHDAVPRGPWQTVRNSELFTVDPYGDVVTMQVPIGVLEVGHQFIGWDHDTVYEVTAPCRDADRAAMRRVRQTGRGPRRL